MRKVSISPWPVVTSWLITITLIAVRTRRLEFPKLRHSILLAVGDSFVLEWDINCPSDRCFRDVSLSGCLARLLLRITVFIRSCRPSLCQKMTDFRLSRKKTTMRGRQQPEFKRFELT